MSIADDLPKQYDPHDAQRRWYDFWLEKGYFHAPDAPKGPKGTYSIVIPPPNVTGALHLGHALNNTLQDILIRWRRMQGYDALWMPGTDHAGIATQAVVERRLLEEEKKTRHDLGREALVARIWAWKDEYEKRILSQLRLMGCSCDWDRTRFTLDPVCARAVRETFFRLFREGLIYRGKRLVNWDTQLRTAVADDEIYYEETQGHLWTIKYPVSGSETGEVLHVATTRPETMLGDTAVAVHPEDPRYRHLIGKTVDLPLTGRQIPVIVDPILVDPAFGTGCVKVTPAHDPNDYQAGLRNKLPMINLLNPDGTYNENAGKYAGLDRLLVRRRVVEDLKAQGSLERVDSYLVRLNHSDRSKTPIEPYLSDQWFVRMGDLDGGRPGLAQQAMDAVTSGRVQIHPERYAKSYLDWLGEKRDWCISRQLWWGHRIPVWTFRDGGYYKDFEPELRARLLAGTLDSFRALLQDAGIEDRVAYKLSADHGEEITLQICTDSEEIDAVLDEMGEYFAADSPRSPLDPCRPALSKFLNGLGNKDEDFVRFSMAFAMGGSGERDPDVLDTWFSSALWPISTLGWPEETPALKAYYPTSVLSTARDIITLWVARMVIFGLFNRNDVPFKNVFIHPVIQDGLGRRMSKSAGNGVDPVDIIDLYGADALRFSLALAATETQDLRIPVEKAKLPDGREINSSERFEQGRNFANKFWNAARFALMNLEGYTWEPIAVDLEGEEPLPNSFKGLPIEDRWILSTLNRVTEEVSEDLERFDFSSAVGRLRDFTWNDFCDWYVEFLKGRLRNPDTRANAQRVLAAVLDGICRLLHPIVPFVTEQVWQALAKIALVRGIPERRCPEAGFNQSNTASESVCVAPWPEYIPAFNDAGAEYTVKTWQRVIVAIRNLKAERNVPKDAKIEPILVASQPVVATMLGQGELFIRSLTGASSLSIVLSAERPPDCAVVVLPDVEVILPLADLIDWQAEAARHRKALGDLEKQLGAVRGKLNNEGFVSRAPAEVVAQQRAREAELAAQREAVAALLAEAERRARPR